MILDGQMPASPALFEDQVSDRRFEIPVDDRDRGQIEGGMSSHHDPDQTGDREDGPEYQTGDGRLLNARHPLVDPKRGITIAFVRNLNRIPKAMPEQILRIQLLGRP